jgi:hypothetical protein
MSNTRPRDLEKVDSEILEDIIFKPAWKWYLLICKFTKGDCILTMNLEIKTVGFGMFTEKYKFS